MGCDSTRHISKENQPGPAGEEVKEKSSKFSVNLPYF